MAGYSGYWVYDNEKKKSAVLISSLWVRKASNLTSMLAFLILVGTVHFFTNLNASATCLCRQAS